MISEQLSGVNPLQPISAKLSSCGLRGNKTKYLGVLVEKHRILTGSLPPEDRGGPRGRLDVGWFG